MKKFKVNISVLALILGLTLAFTGSAFKPAVVGDLYAKIGGVWTDIPDSYTQGGNTHALNPDSVLLVLSCKGVKSQAMRTWFQTRLRMELINNQIFDCSLVELGIKLRPKVRRIKSEHLKAGQYNVYLAHDSGQTMNIFVHEYATHRELVQTDSTSGETRTLLLNYK